ncbi:LLM class flavin-dependent oxidoreductase [Aerococcus sp. UMB7834]|uniref:LLM class flavin-dependent oxidoreductase n=1 Tax=Aerococcus sp. UMB7834 TaxID=3046342 RepID=UPI002549ED38|nr:LLM class flavin-dependent oxidoreductase [Aerococcus sp. UMB7834]MDK6805712.1 LLM class flavin-dependent oxidoreductase [Aerococcus sp. UMB7834]
MSHHILPSFDPSQGLEFGLYSLGEHMPNPFTGQQTSVQERIKEIIEMAVLAEEAGLDCFMLGESHQDYFISQAHFVILSAIAAKTQKIKLGSAASILSTADPVRVFEEAATIDLISDGRMEIVGGRASRLGIFDLFGYDFADYEDLFDEKFDLLLAINENNPITWQGRFRPELKEQKIIPRPQNPDQGLPIWQAVGGSLGSAERAGQRGVPLQLAHLAGTIDSYEIHIDVYRRQAKEAGYRAENLPVSTGGFFFPREDMKEAYRLYYPCVDQGLRLANGRGISKRLFAQGQDQRSVINVGEPNFIIDKVLAQHEAYQNQRYIAQIDNGGMPFDEIKKTIILIGEKILPKIKQYTRV